MGCGTGTLKSCLGLISLFFWVSVFIHHSSWDPPAIIPMKDQLKAFRSHDSHDQNYVSAMIFRYQKFFFSDNEKKLVSIAVFECDESKYYSIFLAVFVQKRPKLGENGKLRY